MVKIEMKRLYTDRILLQLYADRIFITFVSNFPLCLKGKEKFDIKIMQ